MDELKSLIRLSMNGSAVVSIIGADKKIVYIDILNDNVKSLKVNEANNYLYLTEVIEVGYVCG